MVTRALGVLAALVLSLPSSGCAVAWYAAGDATDGEAPPVFAGDPAFATCAYDPEPPTSSAGKPSCDGLPSDVQTVYHCGSLGRFQQYGCDLAGPNLPGYICCPAP